MEAVSSSQTEDETFITNPPESCANEKERYKIKTIIARAIIRCVPESLGFGLLSARDDVITLHYMR